MQSTQVGILMAYFVVVLVIGYLGMRQTRTAADYFVAGGRLGWALGGASIASNQMSSGLFIGTVGLMYGVGWSFGWVVFVFPAAYWFMVSVIAPRFTRQRQLTLADFMASRYYSQGIRVVTALIILVAFIVYIQAQLVAGGIVASTVFGVPLLTGMMIVAVVQILYTFVGGMLADTYSDFVQTSVMVLGALIGVPVVLRNLGGLDNLFTYVSSVNPVALTWDAMPPALLFTLGLAFFLGSVARPEQLVRFYAMRDMPTIRRAIGFVIFLVGATHALVFFIAMGTRVLFPGLTAADQAMPIFVSQAMPTVLGSVLLAAITAAMMSTLDSLLLVAGAALSHDIFGILRPHSTERQKLWVGRIGTVVVGVTALLLLLLGIGGGQVVQLIVALFSALIGSAFCVPVVLGVLWKRATREGAMASMIGGLLAAFGWRLFGDTGLIDPVVPGFLVSLALMVGVSYLTPPPPDEAVEPYFAAPAGAADRFAPAGD